jgi:hypothetical protein
MRPWEDNGLFRWHKRAFSCRNLRPHCWQRVTGMTRKRETHWWFVVTLSSRAMQPWCINKFKFFERFLFLFSLQEPHLSPVYRHLHTFPFPTKGLSVEGRHLRQLTKPYCLSWWRRKNGFFLLLPWLGGKERMTSLMTSLNLLTFKNPSDSLARVSLLLVVTSCCLTYFSSDSHHRSMT